MANDSLNLLNAIAPETKVNCPACNAKGRTKCRKCKGAGQIKCPDCDGTGHPSCPKCNGQGKITYYDKAIGTANGKAGGGVVVKTRQCLACSGWGYLKDEACSCCDGERIIVCPSCSGKGDKTCEECRGKGKITPQELKRYRRRKLIGKLIRLVFYVGLGYFIWNSFKTAQSPQVTSTVATKSDIASTLTAAEFARGYLACGNKVDHDFKGHRFIITGYVIDIRESTVLLGTEKDYITTTKGTINDLNGRPTVLCDFSRNLPGSMGPITIGSQATVVGVCVGKPDGNKGTVALSECAAIKPQ